MARAEPDTSNRGISLLLLFSLFILIDAFHKRLKEDSLISGDIHISRPTH